MTVKNIAGELRGLAARQDADHRARELLTDAADLLEDVISFRQGIIQALAIDDCYTFEGIVSKAREALNHSISAGNLLQMIGSILEVPAGHQHQNLPNLLLERLEAQNMRDGQEKTPEKGAVSDQWVGDVVDLPTCLPGIWLTKTA